MNSPLAPPPAIRPQATPQEARPVSFGPHHALAGWYHPPAAGAAWRDCLVLLVNPIGYDAICTHRHYRQLALRLAAAGFAVLRYDHPGHGDSAGSDRDPQRLPAWTAAVSTAMEFGMALSGARRASLFGVRMGGTLALAAVASGAAASRADTLVAWAPFASGSLYLREMRVMRMLRQVDGSQESREGEAAADDGEEAGGYLSTAETIAALEQLQLTGLLAPGGPAPQRLLMLQRDDIPASDKLGRHLEKIGVEVTRSAATGYAAMMRDTFDAQVPEAALDEIRDWLAGCHPPVDAATAEGRSAGWTPGRGLAGGAAGGSADAEGAHVEEGDADADADADGAAGVVPVPSEDGRLAVRDTPVRFGPQGHLFGIVSTPVQPRGDRGRTAVMFVTTGSNHHIGPNRMYVAHARVLAGLGFVAMRMDIGGVGDSPAAPGERDNHLFARHSIDEVHAGIDYLRSRGVQRVVLVGMCSGAYLSFRGAVAAPAVDSVFLINPQAFNWREGDSLDPHRRKGIRSMNFYRSRMLDRATWGRVLRGQVDTRWIVGGMARLLRKRVTRGLQSALRSRRGAGALSAEQQQNSTDVLALFKGLLQRGVQVFMVFSANDGGLDEVQTYLGERASRLRGPRHFHFEVVDGADHTFTPLWAQDRLCELLVSHVEATHA